MASAPPSLSPRAWACHKNGVLLALALSLSLPLSLSLSWAWGRVSVRRWLLRLMTLMSSSSGRSLFLYPPLSLSLSLSLFFDTARRGPRESAPPRGFAHWGARNGKAQLAGEENHWCANHNTRTLVLDPQPASKAKNQTPHLLALALNYEA